MIAAVIASAIPIIIWLSVFFDKKEKGKKTVALIFLLGCLTAPTLLGIQYLWDIFPQFNIAVFIEDHISTQSTEFIFTFILFGAMEELIKLYVIKAVDERTVLINTVNDAVRYSIVSAMGFSFIENAYYLYQFWGSISGGELAGMYIFRSVFTTCAHIIFSGIFGYYYGIGKYSIVMTQQQQLTSGISKSTRWIAKLFNLPLSQGYRQKVVLKGLLLAIGIHATFNYLLQVSKLGPVILIVILGFFFLQYLLSRKSGHLLLTQDITKKAKATIAKKDKEVVIELLGMWFKDQRFVDVIHICERLLERDPDNRVVQLFKAKAMDQMDENHTYKKILGKILRTQDEMSEYDRNIINKYTEEKEEFEKAKMKIKKQLEKEGKTFIDTQTKAEKSNNKSPVEKFTGDGTFQL